MPFKKGQSGNPGGRKAVPKEITIAAQMLCPEAVKTIGDLMRSSDDNNIRLKAANSLLDRGYGRPPQSVQLEGGDSPIEHLFKWADAQTKGD